MEIHLFESFERMPTKSWSHLHVGSLSWLGLSCISSNFARKGSFERACRDKWLFGVASNRPIVVQPLFCTYYKTGTLRFRDWLLPSEIFQIELEKWIDYFWIYSSFNYNSQIDNFVSNQGIRRHCVALDSRWCFEKSYPLKEEPERVLPPRTRMHRLDIISSFVSLKVAKQLRS